MFHENRIIFGSNLFLFRNEWQQNCWYCALQLYCKPVSKFKSTLLMVKELYLSEENVVSVAEYFCRIISCTKGLLIYGCSVFLGKQWGYSGQWQDQQGWQSQLSHELWKDSTVKAGIWKDFEKNLDLKMSEWSFGLSLVFTACVKM